jgi:hypothetical protein
MPDFNDFASWLFPGDTIIRRNPTDVPDSVEPLLEEVASCTNIPLDWVERTAGLVIEGLAGLQCLWYLHGLRGEIAEEVNAPGPFGAIGKELQNIVLNHMEKRREQLYARPKPIILDVNHAVKWGSGVLVEKVHYSKGGGYGSGASGEWKHTSKKLGKLLRKGGASPELMHAFETRELPTWNWEISCHPYDILTMSHERPWTSCMRPGGEYQYGPLTDMAAGSALLFFYRPGAAKPCGRRILRPFVADLGGTPQMTILDGGRTYGCGPSSLKDRDIEKLLRETSGVDFPVVKDSLCRKGHFGRALTRYIYSDTDHQECSQGDDEYDAAYITLDSVEWPLINLDFTTMAAVAESFRGLAEVDLEDAEEEYDIQALAYAAYEEISGNMELSDIYSSLVDPGVLGDALAAHLADEGYVEIPEHIAEDIYGAVEDYLGVYLVDRVNERSTLAFAIPPGDHEAVRKAEQDAPVELNPPDYSGGDAIHALNIYENEDGDFLTEDGEEVAEILLVSEAFRHYMPNSLWNVAVATGELSEWFDWEYSIRQDI